MVEQQDWQSLESFAFGDSPEMADQLLAFVLAGAKTATCWSIRDGQQTEVQKVSFNNPVIDVSATRTRGWRGAEIPAAGGTGNARSVAEIHTILANGGVAMGKRFMSEAGCRKALELQIEGPDLVLGMPARFGMGFGLAGGTVPLPNPQDSMYWGGYGGSIIMIDMKARTTIAYAMNKMAGTTTGDMRAFGLAMAMWGALGAI